MDDSDTDLALEAAKGDRRAFERLLTRNYDRIYRVAYRVIGNRSEAQDVAQEICTGLPAKLKGFRGDAAFSTWLYRVVMNAGRDQLRRKAAQQRITSEWGNVQVLHRETDAQKLAELDWLTRAVTKLSDDLRETVALVLGEEMSHAHAGAVLGVSEGTISWRMSEVRKALKLMAAEEARFA